MRNWIENAVLFCLILLPLSSVMTVCLSCPISNHILSLAGSKTPTGLMADEVLSPILHSYLEDKVHVNISRRMCPKRSFAYKQTLVNMHSVHRLLRVCGFRSPLDHSEKLACAGCRKYIDLQMMWIHNFSRGFGCTDTQSTDTHLVCTCQTLHCVVNWVNFRKRATVCTY